jgi:prepilin-type N-terminal cleavage/methylation domain-containing protein
MRPNLKAKYGGLKMKFMKSGQKGFTLIELLVVIAILGTLAGVVVLNVIQFIGSGTCQAAATEKHNIQTAAVAAAYSAGSPTGIDFADCQSYLLTTPKYDWSSSVNDGVVDTEPDDWPGTCSFN